MMSTVLARLLLIGAGGHGRVVADIARELGTVDILFLDDRWPSLSSVGNWPVVGTSKDVNAHMQGRGVVVTIGDNQRRLALHGELERTGISQPALVHPKAVVSREAKIGAASVVMAGVVVNIGAKVGKAVILNTACTIDHDCDIGDGAHVSPGAHLGGGVSVGRRTWIGIGATVRHSTSIGDDVMVGAGAAVIAEVRGGSRVAGVPAKPLKDI